MPKKKKLPPWLVAMLAIILLTLLIIAAMPGAEKNEQVAVKKPQASIVFEELTPDSVQAPTFESPGEVFTGISPERVPDSEALSAPDADSDSGIALVMDDVGYDMHILKRVLRLSVPVAIAILPGAPFASEAASLAHRQDQIVMLHLPMEPTVPRYQKRMTDTFLREAMSESELRQTFLKDLARIPYVEGVNNHMGSRLTQLSRPMSLVMQICREKGLFFIDSKTSNTSVAAQLASNMGVEWASRRYFLDNQLDEQAMLQSWNSARACVGKGHRCIVIAHPHKETISFLEKHLTTEDMIHMLSVKQVLRFTPSTLESSQQGNALEQLL